MVKNVCGSDEHHPIA